MLVLRYFAFVGGALLALLLVCNAVLPKPPATDGAVASAGEVPVIRIHSERKWPERIVLDTNAAMPVPVKVAKADAPVQALAELSATARVRQAFAQFAPDEPTSLAAEAKKPEAKALPKRKFARARLAPAPHPPMMLVAQQPRFGFFTW